MNAPPWEVIAAELAPFVRRRVGDDADDVLQEVLLRVHRGLPELKDPERMGPWMVAVARSAIADHGRRRAREKERPSETVDEVEDPTEPLRDDDNLASTSLAAVLRHFVADLPEPYREVIELTELEGLTQREAAERLGISLTAVKSRVARGRRQLRGALEACCEIALDARHRVVDFQPRGGPCC